MNHREQVNALKQENGELREANARLTQVNKAQAETIVELKKPKAKKAKGKRHGMSEAPADSAE